MNFALTFLLSSWIMQLWFFLTGPEALVSDALLMWNEGSSTLCLDVWKIGATSIPQYFQMTKRTLYPFMLGSWNWYVHGYSFHVTTVIEKKKSSLCVFGVCHSDDWLADHPSCVKVLMSGSTPPITHESPSLYITTISHQAISVRSHCRLIAWKT